LKAGAPLLNETADTFLPVFRASAPGDVFAFDLQLGVLPEKSIVLNLLTIFSNP
jgi:hypothetical protein